MKILKMNLIWIIVFTFCVSCNYAKSKNTNTDYANAINENNLAYKRITQPFQEKLKYNNVYDATNGMVVCQIPLPESWNYNANKNAEITIKAPNNVIVNKTEVQNYAYAKDAFALESLQLVSAPNITISPVYSLQEILQNYIVPLAQSQGQTLINSYKLPSVLGFWNRFESGLLRTGSKKQYHVLGSDWKDAQGNKLFLVLVQLILDKGQFVNWTLQSTQLEAPEAYFDTAKKAFIHGLSNTQINMKWQQFTNNKLLRNIQNNQTYWANATRQSRVAHNQRMAVIQSRGDAIRKVGKIYSDVLDINHAGFLKRSNLNAATHAKTIDAIAGNATISNMATGESYKVEDGSEYYWVNANGEYFGTNNAFYDPRIDKKINNSEWTQFEIQD